MELVRYRSDDVEEWSALYKDGVLEVVGDHYLIDERIAALAGVQDRDGDFTCDTGNRDRVPHTLVELEEWLGNANATIDAQEVEAIERKIAELEAQKAAIRNRNV